MIDAIQPPECPFSASEIIPPPHPLAANCFRARVFMKLMHQEMPQSGNCSNALRSSDGISTAVCDSRSGSRVLTFCVHHACLRFACITRVRSLKLDYANANLYTCEKIRDVPRRRERERSDLRKTSNGIRIKI